MSWRRSSLVSLVITMSRRSLSFTSRSHVEPGGHSERVFDQPVMFFFSSVLDFDLVKLQKFIGQNEKNLKYLVSK